MRRFEGRTAVVTGAGSGVGRATAIRLAAEGAAVACLDVVFDAAEQGRGHRVDGRQHQQTAGRPARKHDTVLLDRGSREQDLGGTSVEVVTASVAKKALES